MNMKEKFNFNQKDINVDIFNIENDEEVVNCEGNPCSFIIKGLDEN